jgi:hypothetical protein
MKSPGFTFEANVGSSAAVLALLLRRQVVVHLLADQAGVDVVLGEFPDFAGKLHGNGPRFYR